MTEDADPEDTPYSPYPVPKHAFDGVGQNTVVCKCGKVVKNDEELMAHVREETDKHLPEVHKFTFFASRRSIGQLRKLKNSPRRVSITMETADLDDAQFRVLATARELVFHVEVQWRDWAEVSQTGNPSGDVTG